MQSTWGMIKLLIATLLITSTLSAVCTTLEDVRCQSCKTENNTDSCVTCHMGYFKPAEGQTKAACVDPETKVDNCLYYSDKTTCSTCMAGYYLDTNKCVANTQDDCFAETNKKCTVCYGGFLPNSEGDGDSKCVADSEDSKTQNCFMLDVNKKCDSCDYG